FALHSLSFVIGRPAPGPPLFPYTTLFRSPASSRRVSIWWSRHRRTPASSTISNTTSSALGGSGSRSSVSHATKLARADTWTNSRSEEHTSELQSRENLVCRLLLEKKKI